MGDDKPLLSQTLSESMQPLARRLWMEDLQRLVDQDEATWHLLHGDNPKPGEEGFDEYLKSLEDADG